MYGDSSKTPMNPDVPSATPANAAPPSGLTTRRPFFRHDPYTTIFTLALIVVGSQLLAAVLIGIYPNIRTWTGDQAKDWLGSIPANFVYVVLAETLAVVAVLRILKWAHVPLKRIGLVKPRIIDIAYALASYAAYFAVYVVVIILAGVFLKDLNIDQKQQLGFDDPAGNGQLLMAFFSLVVLPPIAEEIMFRGFLYSGLRAKLRIRYAVIITSVIFGIAHLEFGSGSSLVWVAAIDTFTLSCFLCYLREKTNSIWPGVGLHAIKNLVAYVALYHTRL